MACNRTARAVAQVVANQVVANQVAAARLVTERDEHPRADPLAVCTGALAALMVAINLTATLLTLLAQ